MEKSVKFTWFVANYCSSIDDKALYRKNDFEKIILDYSNVQLVSLACSQDGTSMIYLNYM